MAGPVIAYRPEIDGLRAVAVLSVILFHADFAWASGGFVGVDVFFVISGFLITSLILKEKGQGSFSFGGFYERRIRRLLPPLIPVLALTFAGAFVLFQQPQFVDFSQSLYATLALVSNWYFLDSIGYFDAPASSKPLLHMWSLSIEEQFYLVWPAVIVGVLWLSSRRVLQWVIVAITAASLGYAIWLVAETDANIAFFNSFARFWEISIGALLATVPAAQLRHQKAAIACTTAGLALILGSVVFYSTSVPFPGASALVPTLGAVLIIMSGAIGGPVTAVLASRPFTYVGKLSYALYLWHWPLLVFAGTLVPKPGVVTISAAIGLSFVLSAVSYRYIEAPIRKRQLFPTRRSAYALAGSACAAFVALLVVSATPLTTNARLAMLYGERWPIVAAIESERLEYESEHNRNFKGRSGTFSPTKHKGFVCSYDEANTFERLLTCLAGQAGEHNILVMGDSIGRDTFHSLRLAYPDKNFIMLHHSGCPPGEVALKKSPKVCFYGIDRLLERIAKRINVDVALLAFRYKPGNWMRVGPTLDKSKALFDKVVMLGTSPVFKREITAFTETATPLTRDVRLNDPTMVRWDYGKFADEARRMAEDHGVTFVNVYPFFCNDTSCRLWTDDAFRKPLFWDAAHLTPSGMRAFAEFLASQSALRQALFSRVVENDIRARPSSLLP